MKEGAALVGMLAPTLELDLVRTAAEKRLSMLSLEFVPRISRAQAMDVLSSQANLAGYKAVLLGASHCPKLMPMMITAAGTLAPGRVFVVGVGVAGLQAIATAKRLGAIVEAYDVRPATKEQVLSLGARFVELPGASGGETEGGYAKEQTDEDRQKQAELMAKHVVGADVVITTAAVFGKAPPLLIPADVAERMKPGSVLVDLAANPAHGRGNCELTRPGEIHTTEQQVTLVGTTNLPGTMPVHASTVLANNVYALLETLIAPPQDDGESGTRGPDLHLDLDDEIHMGALITHAGEVVDDLVKSILEQEGASS
jgi:NAD(P) transhydrogenase subunit alpha